MTIEEIRALTLEERGCLFGFTMKSWEIYDKPRIFTDTLSSGKTKTKTIIGVCEMGCEICGKFSPHEILSEVYLKCIHCGVAKSVYQWELLIKKNKL